MKKTLGWLFALLPLLGIAFFSIFAHSAVQNVASHVRLDTPKKPAVPLQTDSRGAEDIFRSKQIEDKLNESMARSAKAMTPELQRFLIDALMRSREPRYRALFESWQLDSATANLTLEIIRERETRFKEALRKCRQEGISGKRTFVETCNTENTYAKIQLNGLLGENRFKELSRQESQMNSEMQVKAQAFSNSKE